ncbi:MAG: TetR/AcrR family transcriptional regulator [Candidatus Thorarchaeota archaeon]
MSGSTKRTYNKQQKEKAIQDTTVDLLLKRGYPNLTTKEIAEKAGVAIGLLYKYFPAGKVEIIKRIAEGVAEGAIDRVKLNSEHFDIPDDIDIREFMRSSMLKTVEFHRQDKAMIIAIEMAYLSDPEVFGYHALDNYMNYINLASRMFIKLTAERLGKKIDENFAKFVIDIVDAAIHRHILLIPSAPTDEEFANALADLVLNLLSSQQ